jgi:hypothetical protein
MRRGILSAVLGLLLATAAAPAWAQTTTTNYQPPGCGSPTVNIGTAAPGGSVTGTIGPSCHFTGTVSMAVNGGAAGTKTPNAGNGVNVSIQVVTTTSGLLNDPVAVNLQLGTNKVTATGPTDVGPQTVTGFFTVVAPTAVTVTPAAPTSRVAFTGANILRWSVAAAALLGIGVLMVWASRRRRPTL